MACEKKKKEREERSFFFIVGNASFSLFSFSLVHPFFFVSFQKQKKQVRDLCRRRRVHSRSGKGRGGDGDGDGDGMKGEKKVFESVVVRRKKKKTLALFPRCVLC